MAEGFIKLHRCLIDKPIFQNEKLLKVWLWCLFKATHKPITALIGVKKIELQPGQFIFGRLVAAKDLKMSQSMVYRYITFLKDNQSLDIKTNNKYSLVTVVNWGLYQTTRGKVDSNIDSKRTTNEQQMNTYKKSNKNYKNVKKKDRSLFEIAIDDFIEFRKGTKPPMTEKAVTLLLNKLEELAPGDETTKIKILEQSILNGWKGVFALKADAPKQQSKFDELEAWANSE